MRCSYCTREIPKGTGTMYVKKIGTVKYYCSNRCFEFDVRQGKKQNMKQQKGLLKAAKAEAEKRLGIAKQQK
ncbi:50S ribosomal protein L24e [uncultured archaeon]|nr:50S ribosomal protein L24e [uncultured archaeon]